MTNPQENHSRMPENYDSLISSLRQKAPFLYVDSITGCNPEMTSISGEVTFAQKNRYLPELFPDVLMLEAMAQLSSVLLRFYTGSTLGGVLVAIDNAKFLAPLKSDFPVQIKVDVLKQDLPIFGLKGTVSQHGKLLCQAGFTTKSNLGVIQ